eukprot:4102280-Pyramimonas_sp.AAC.1
MSGVWARGVWHLALINMCLAGAGNIGPGNLIESACASERAATAWNRHRIGSAASGCKTKAC